MSGSGTLPARFWAKVNHDGPLPAGQAALGPCWLWCGSKLGRDGYGGVYVDRRPGQRWATPSYAHRVAWQLTHGPIPEGGHILHHCDTPYCVNPAHLFLGNHGLNMKDAAAKGRLHMPRPSRRKVTDADVATMFAMRADGALLSRIADRFDVTKCYVSLVLRGKRRVYTAPQQQHAIGA